MDAARFGCHLAMAGAPSNAIARRSRSQAGRLYSWRIESASVDGLPREERSTSRVLVLTQRYFPEAPSGAARLAFDVAAGLRDAGHEVWLLARGTSRDTSGLSSQDGFRVLRYWVDRGGLRDFARHRRHIDAVKSVLGTFFPGRPDLIHGHDLLQQVAALAFFEGKVPMFYSVHSPAAIELSINWGTPGLEGRLKKILGLPLIRRFERRVLEDADGLQVASEFTRSLLRELYGDAIADRATLIPGWVNTGRFRPLTDVVGARTALGWPQDRPVLFALRRLERRMGLGNLLKAVSMVRSSVPPFLVVIGGTGSEEVQLAGLAKDLHLAETVRFMGQVPEAILPTAYAASDASVVPTDQLECFGLTTLEAMACGRPALVTPVGALPEVVGPFEPAWVSQSSSPTHIADLLRRFLRGELPKHSQAQIRHYVVERFDQEAHVTAYLAFLGTEEPIGRKGNDRSNRRT